MTEDVGALTTRGGERGEGRQGEGFPDTSDALSAARAAIAEIERRERGDGRLNDFVSLADPGSLTAPRAGPLQGVPIAIKDNIATLDLPTTCASRMLGGYMSPFEATVVRRLREAGAIVVGKTNLDEFAMGSSTEHSVHGPTLNPHDRGRVPGGSSGGSAAAVASGAVPVALGSETGGSIRQPAALCGVVGLKPTYGRVSRYGLVAFASSLDQIGAFGRTVAEAAGVLEVIAGHDPRDATSADLAVPPLRAAAGEGVKGMVIGVPEEYFPPDLDGGVRAACDRALDRLKELGATVRPVSLPSTRFAVPTYYVICTAEASSNLARFDGVRYGARAAGATSTDELFTRTRSQGFGAEVKRRILLGTFVLSAGYHDAYYGRAQRTRELIRSEMEGLFSGGIDALFTPTTPAPAFRLGERLEDPLRMYLSDVFTVTANLAGIPAASIPIGESDGLPVGGQVLAPRWGEPAMIRVAAALEEPAR